MTTVDICPYDKRPCIHPRCAVCRHYDVEGSMELKWKQCSHFAGAMGMRYAFYVVSSETYKEIGELARPVGLYLMRNTGQQLFLFDSYDTTGEAMMAAQQLEDGRTDA